MTTLQLKIAVTVAEQQSITAAARMLGISQPNASNSLKLLEDELGFHILLRTTTGVTVTPKGIKFLSYARRMLKCNDLALKLRNDEDVFSLRLGTVNYYAAAEPFFSLCEKHRDDASADLNYVSVSISEGIEELANRNLDIVAAPVMKHQLTGLARECSKENIQMVSICQIPAVIMMRKDHPALLDERCHNITQGCDVMKDYPYVGLHNIISDADSTGYSDSNFIQSSYKIFVDDTNIRLRTIEATNGFGFGILSSYRMMKHYQITSLPVPGVSLELFCLIRSGEEKQCGIHDYLVKLKDEMKRMIKTKSI